MITVIGILCLVGAAIIPLLVYDASNRANLKLVEVTKPQECKVLCSTMHRYYSHQKTLDCLVTIGGETKRIFIDIDKNYKFRAREVDAAKIIDFSDPFAMKALIVAKQLNG